MASTTLETDMVLDGEDEGEGMEGHPPQQSDEPIEAPHVIVTETKTLKAIGVNSARTDAKKALDALTNEAEAEGWTIEGFGHTEKFDKDLNVVHTFTSKLVRDVKVGTLTFTVL